MEKSSLTKAAESRQAVDVSEAAHTSHCDAMAGLSWTHSPVLLCPCSLKPTWTPAWIHEGRSILLQLGLVHPNSGTSQMKSPLSAVIRSYHEGCEAP